jgi:DNA-directed RNA polymerase subunit E'/Rpb7
METITTLDWITLPSSELGSNLHHSLSNILRQREGTCSKKNGCVVRFVSLNKILEARIDFNYCTNRFHVDYTFESFLPRIGIVYPARVVSVYPEGSIVAVNDCDFVSALLIDAHMRVGECINVTLKEIAFRPKVAFQCVAESLA